MQRSQSYTVLPWPQLSKTDIALTKAEVIGRVCARQTGFVERLSGDISLRLVFYPYKYEDTNLIDSMVNVMPYLKGIFHVVGISFGDIKVITAVWKPTLYGGKISVLIEEIDGR